MVFDEVMAVLKRHSGFEMFSMEEETVISLPGLTIYPEQRKIYRNGQENHLTVKEYDLLCLLAYNKGRVLIGRESNAVSCHIRNLREKLLQASPSTTFHIKCVREVGTVWKQNNREGDLVLMSIDAFEKREQMLQLRARVLQAEQERIDGEPTISVSEARKRLRERASEV